MASSRLDGEALGLIALGFQPYHVVTLYCADHGFIRISIPAQIEIGDTWTCPICHAVRSCASLAMLGFTRRPLPHWERLIGAIDWSEVSEDEYIKPRPKRRKTRVRLPVLQGKTVKRDGVVVP